jgi:biopolymer transport protein ExbB
MSALELFHQGGFIMYPLTICSILVWTVAIHKWFFLKAFTKDYQKMDQAVQGALASNKIDELKFLVKNGPVVLARAHEPLMENNFSSSDAMSDKLNRRISEVNAYLRKDLWILGTIASSAPFIGLFGTVLGIMDSFRSIGVTGKSGFSVVAAGISEALIATAAGIIVAVVAVIFYNYLQTRVNAIAADFRNKLEDTTEVLKFTQNRK